MKTTIRTLLTVIALALFLSPAAKAAEYGGIRELSLYPLVQYFTWEEFSGGQRLLKESGFQYGAGGAIKLHLLEGEAGAMTLSDSLEIFGSEVDYEGQLQDGTPSNTTVGYVGFQDRLDLGWAIPIINSATVEPFIGLGYRWWLRDLQGSGGYTEQWYSISALLGMRSQYQLDNDTKLFVLGAGKYPFSNKNSIDNYPGVDKIRLSPGSEWSAIAEGGIRYKRLIATLYYESFIFPKSNSVTEFNALRRNVSGQLDPGPNVFSQPRSESEIFGLRLGWAFK